jgi:pimeloyl-ACP methyl ester carboxylesterase
VHIIRGAEDTWIPANRGAQLEALIPRSSLAAIADAGHLIQLDAPEALTVELTRWLERNHDATADAVA